MDNFGFWMCITVIIVLSYLDDIVAALNALNL